MLAIESIIKTFSSQGEQRYLDHIMLNANKVVQLVLDFGGIFKLHSTALKKVCSEK